jgi:hypothetical protein
MDRPPETPDEPVNPDQPETPGEDASSPPAEPVSPYGPDPGTDEPTPPLVPPAPPGPPGSDVSQAPEESAVPQSPNPYGPPGPAFAAAPDGTAPQDTRPGLGTGIATGCGLQVLGVVVVFGTLAYVGSIWGILWPFIIITVLAGLLMISRRWRRFATGVLIVTAAMWIVVLGPCVAVMGGLTG